jgi:hypothetical protein
MENLPSLGLNKIEMNILNNCSLKEAVKIRDLNTFIALSVRKKI